MPHPMKCAAALAVFALLWSAGNARAEVGNWYSIPIAASHNSNEQVQALIMGGGHDPDEIESVGGHTALDYAASYDNRAMAQLLLDHGAHIDAPDKLGSTALSYAAEMGHLDMIRMLVAHHATVDAPNTQGITPLMVAADHEQPGAVRLLMQDGADPKRQDFTGRDALGWAADHANVVQVLKTAR